MDQSTEMLFVPEQHIGKLTLKYYWTGDHDRIWKCTCRCGKNCYIKEAALMSGIIRDCGCCGGPTRKPMATFPRKAIKIGTRTRYFCDLSDSVMQQFNVVRFHGLKGRRIMWECTCLHCGKTVILSSSELHAVKQPPCPECNYQTSDIL